MQRKKVEKEATPEVTYEVVVSGEKVGSSAIYVDYYQALDGFYEALVMLQAGCVVELKSGTEILKSYQKPSEGSTANDNHNKWLERKFLIAVISPLLAGLLRWANMSDYFDFYLPVVVEVVMWSAPVLWIWIEGQLDRKKIEGSTKVKVQELRNVVGQG